jgi:hypothetical protein
MKVESASPAAVQKAKKVGDPRKHRYVPVFYQKGFANDAGLLWVYDRNKGTYKELHPLSICFKKDLYAVKPEGKPPNMQVETDILKVIDYAGSVGIRDFMVNNPGREAEQEVALFMAFQWTRVPTMSRDVRATYAKLIEELIRVASASVERVRTLIEQHERETGEVIDVTAESMVESVRGRHFEIVATEAAFLATMLEQAMSLTKVLLQLDWEVLIAPNETGFIVCDCPVVVVPPRGSNQVGFVVPESAKYFPLSRRLCLRLGEPGKRRRLRKLDKEAVRIVNLNIAANSERFIMGASKEQIENVVSRSACQKVDLIPRLTVETIESDENGSLQKLSSHPRRYFYPKGVGWQAP